MNTDTATLSFDDVWKPPFHSIDFDDGLMGVHILNRDNDVCFNFCAFTFKDIQADIIKALNGEIVSDELYNIVQNNEVYHDSLNLFIGDVKLLLVRGWGRLTGTYALHLSDENAIGYQEQLLDYAVDKIKNCKNL